MIAFATWGLFVAWLLHDVEELITMPHWGRRNAARIKRIYPWLPEWILSRLDLPRGQVNLAIGLVGVLMFVAAADGARTGGASEFYQIVLAAFGIHSLFHLGQSVIARGYTPGVLSAPTVVAPFSAGAWWIIGRSDVVSPVSGQDILVAVVIFPVVAAGTHGLAALILRTVRALR